MTAETETAPLSSVPSSHPLKNDGKSSGFEDEKKTLAECNKLAVSLRSLKDRKYFNSIDFAALVSNVLFLNARGLFNRKEADSKGPVFEITLENLAAALPGEEQENLQSFLPDNNLLSQLRKTFTEFQSLTKSLKVSDQKIKTIRNLCIFFLLGIVALIAVFAGQNAADMVNLVIGVALSILVVALGFILVARRLLALDKLKTERLKIYVDALVNKKNSATTDRLLAVNTIDRYRNIGVGILYVFSIPAAIAVLVFRESLLGQFIGGALRDTQGLDALLGFVIPGFAVVAVVAVLATTLMKIGKSEQEIKELENAINNETDWVQYQIHVVKLRDRKEKMEMMVFDSCVFFGLLGLQIAALFMTAGASETIIMAIKAALSMIAIISTSVLYFYHDNKQDVMEAVTTENLWDQHVLNICNRQGWTASLLTALHMEKWLDKLNVERKCNHTVVTSIKEKLDGGDNSLFQDLQGHQEKYEQVSKYLQTLATLNDKLNGSKSDNALGDEALKNYIYDHLQQDAGAWLFLKCSLITVFSFGYINILKKHAQKIIDTADALKDAESDAAKKEIIKSGMMAARSSLSDAYMAFFRQKYFAANEVAEQMVAAPGQQVSA